VGSPVAELGDVRVFSGPAEGGGPVYALGGGTLAVPTGRMFVRFAEGADPRAASEALAAAGFRVASVPGYAPGAAWVEPVDGGIGGALGRIAALRAIPGVEHAEPEMLTERGARG
jgi:hypothetical protein